MGSRYYYDRDGQYITLNQWAVLMGDDDYRRVEQTWVGRRRYLVSTVWLGLNHNVMFPEHPHIFETCVFDHHNMLDMTPIIGHPLPDSEVMDRYSTLDEARKGHRRIVLDLRKEVNNTV